jgi:hypothetical protein
MSRIRTLLSILLSLSTILDLDALLRLVKASTPLPSTAAEVRPWLTGLGITTPLSNLIAPVLESILATAPTVESANLAALEMAISEALDDLEASATPECSALNPALRAILYELALLLARAFITGAAE